MKVLISGYYRDKWGTFYFLVTEPAKDLGDGSFLIVREFSIIVRPVTL